MSEATHITRRCGKENPRTAAINKAAEESGLGFSMNYPSLVGKTVVLAWVKMEEARDVTVRGVIERGELAAVITGLMTSENMWGYSTITLTIASPDPRFRHFTYDAEKKRWQPHMWELPSGDRTLEGVSVQINLA